MQEVRSEKRKNILLQFEESIFRANDFTNLYSREVLKLSLRWNLALCCINLVGYILFIVLSKSIYAQAIVVSEGKCRFLIKKSATKGGEGGKIKSISKSKYL